MKERLFAALRNLGEAKLRLDELKFDETLDGIRAAEKLIESVVVGATEMVKGEAVMLINTVPPEPEEVEEPESYIDPGPGGRWTRVWVQQAPFNVGRCDLEGPGGEKDLIAIQGYARDDLQGPTLAMPEEVAKTLFVDLGEVLDVAPDEGEEWKSL